MNSLYSTGGWNEEYSSKRLFGYLITEVSLD
jgi:hypothetical protein